MKSFIDAITWINIVYTSHKSFEENLNVGYSKINSNKAPSTKQDIAVTFLHEIVHFLHSLSTVFLYNYSTVYWQGYNKLIHYLRKFGPCNDVVDWTQLTEDTIRKNWLLDPEQQLNNIDIIEGLAVFLSYRMTFADKSHNDFIDYLRYRHEGQEHYKRAYNLISKEFGGHAFELFSPICYLAMQTEHPYKSFYEIVSQLSQLKVANPDCYRDLVEDANICKMLDILNLSAEEHLLHVLMNLKEGGDEPNIILKPYLKYLITGIKDKVLSLDTLSDIMARPYQYLPFEDGGLLSFFYLPSQKATDGSFHLFRSNIMQFKLQPPVRIYFNEKDALGGYGFHMSSASNFKLLGPTSVFLNELPLSTHSDDYINKYYTYIQQFFAMVGIIRGLAFANTGQIEMICGHDKCPLHSDKLCCSYLWFPDQNYSECVFKSFVETQTGHNYSEFKKFMGNIELNREKIGKTKRGK